MTENINIFTSQQRTIKCDMTDGFKNKTETANHVRLCTTTIYIGGTFESFIGKQVNLGYPCLYWVDMGYRSHPRKSPKSFISKTRFH